MGARASRWVLAIAVAVGGSCRSSPPKEGPADAYVVALGALQTRAAGSRGDDRSWQRQTLLNALDATSSMAAGDGAALQVDAEVLEVRTTRGLIVRVTLKMDVPPDLAGVLEGLDATVEIERNGGDASLRDDLPAAAHRAAVVLDTKLRLARTPAAAVELLRADDAELRLLALDWVETQRDRGSAAAVAELLGHPDERVALRAVEVLGTIGAASEVPALIASARLSDPDHTGRLYEALASLGGPDAEGFLAFAARNEDDPVLARLAERALGKAQRSEPQPGTSPEPDGAARGHR